MPRAGEGDARQMRGMRGWLSACSLEADINAVHRRSAKGLRVIDEPWRVGRSVDERVDCSIRQVAHGRGALGSLLTVPLYSKKEPWGTQGSFRSNVGVQGSQLAERITDQYEPP